MEIVVRGDVGNRIDKFVAENTELTRSNVQRLIEIGKILVNRERDESCL